MNRGDAVKALEFGEEPHRFAVSFVFEKRSRFAHGSPVDEWTEEDVRNWVKCLIGQGTRESDLQAVDIKALPLSNVACSLCGKVGPGNVAHLHQGKWVGDDCCWDEKLRSTE